MIENYPDLPQCEQKLSKEPQKVRLLGEIPLSPEDLDHLGALIRQKISADIRNGTGFLEREAPTCLACFLVWMGIVGYRDGNYWPAVQESIGLVNPNWQVKWGQIFVKFLQANDLPRFDIEGGHSYLTPILTHGGIPDSCLEEFFEKLLLPLVQRELIDPTDPEEITHELTLRREDNEARVRVEQQYSDLQQQMHALEEKVQQTRRVVEAYDKVIHLWELQESATELQLSARVLEDYETFRKRNLKRIHHLENLIRDFERKQARCEQVLTSLSEQDTRSLAQAEAIEQTVSEYAALAKKYQTVTMLEAEEGEFVHQLNSRWTRIFSEPWDDQYGKLLSQLPFDKLGKEIERLEALVSRQEEERETLNHFKAASDASSPTWLILSMVWVLLGLTLILIGTQIFLPSVPVLSGIGLAMIVALVGWFWHRKATRKQRQIEGLEDTLEKTTSQRSEVHENIIRILGHLSMADQQLAPPSSDLYQALISLVDTYRELCRIRNRRLQLQQEIQEQVRRTTQAATEMGIQGSEDLTDLISNMTLALEGARDRYAAASQAERDLENKVFPKIVGLKAEHRAIRKELAQVEKRLAELGGGHIQAGIERVEAQRRLQNAAAKLRTALKGRYPNLETMEREIQNAQKNSKSKTALEGKVGQLTKRLEKVQEQANGLKQELSYYPAVFTGMDEPIRRYLLYGGEAANEFLVRSVSLIHRASSEGSVPDADDVHLPQRVVKQFERWWAENIPYVSNEVAPDEPDTERGQRFRAPAIMLEPSTAEIMAHFHAQHYLASVRGTTACLEVMASDSDQRRQTFPLRVYRSTQDLLETEEREFPLTFPANRYEFRLKSDGGVIRRWDVTAMRNDPACMVFEWRSGKLIKDEELQKGKLYFFLHKDFSVRPASCILERGPLHGQWKDYIFLALDLEKVDKLQIIDDQDRGFLIPVSSERPPTLDLIGGQPLTGVHSDGVQVYVGKPPSIRLPIKDEAELRLWRISVWPVEESSLQEWKHLRLSEFREALDVQVGEGWVDILLTNEHLMGQHPVGTFKIRVRKPPYTDWHSTFCVVSELEVASDKDVYLPYEVGKEPNIRVELSLPEDARFIPQSPAQIIDTGDNCYAIGIDGSEDVLRGILDHPSPNGGQVRIRLTISIPKVRWRLQGLEDDPYGNWHDTIMEEVWLADWEAAQELFLVVELPSLVDGQLVLGLREYPVKRDERAIRDRKARFDLLAFGDALRAGPSVQTLILTHPDSQMNIKDAPLLSVRTRWVAEDIECVQTTQGRTIVLEVEWIEKGKADDKVIRVWSFSTTKTRPVKEQVVAKDARTAKIEASVKELPPGRYLLQLESRDQWSTTPISRPAKDSLNTREIHVVSCGDLRQGEIFLIGSVADNQGKSYDLDGQYKIRIRGKIVNMELPPSVVGIENVLVTSTNEGWYVGNLRVSAHSLLEAEICETNPVKFEYKVSEDYITAIEDKDGDGPEYCIQCRRLSWNQKRHSEEDHGESYSCKKGEHPLFRYVEVFKISWES